MFIADSQVHLWTDKKPNPWHKQVETYDVATLLAEMDGAGVDRAIVVPPYFSGDDNSVALAAARAHPDRLAVLGRLPLDTPAPQETFDRWLDQEGMYGLRFTFATPEQQAMLHTDGALDWLWSGAEKAGFPVMMMCSGHVETVPAIAEAHPKLKLTVDHLGLGQQKDDEAFAKLDLLLALAKYPNVTVKACTLPVYSTEAYPYRNTHKYLKQVYDAFGAHRVFWGSDLTRLPGSYRECVTMFTEELDFLSQADREATMGKALCDWIGWKV
jgi:predicted TIM-barrel fold metal-dependent hydrolase